MTRRSFEVIEERSGGAPGRGEALDTDRLGRVVALGRALSDPIRVRMLGMLAEGRNCCDLPDLSAPVAGGEEDPLGICVCKFEGYYGMGTVQSLLPPRQAERGGPNQGAEARQV
jgi:ArsR family transcriptional regulator, arsenate/arsenite/antimonite-responsive transcriptional repressor